MSKKKIEKDYYFEWYLDEFENKYLIDKAWCRGYFKYKGKCWKDCLYKFFSVLHLRMISDGYEEKFANSLIGIRHFSITCNDKPVDFNYINRLIYQDEKLYNHFWC